MTPIPWIILTSCLIILPFLWISTSTSDPSLFLSRLHNASTAKFNPKDSTTILAFILTALGSAFSAAGGIGGGGLFVPMFNLVLRFDTRTSAILSNFLIFAGMSANLLLSSFQRDPSDPTQPLIDFHATLLMQPSLLLGISLGVICNVMFPGWLITLLLTIILFFVTVRSFTSAFKLWRLESQLQIRDNKTICSEEVEECLLEQKLSETSSFLVAKLVTLLLVWLFFLGLQLFRGLKTRPCGTRYWLVTASQIPATLVITLLTAWHDHRAAASDVKNRWTQSRAHFVLPAMGFITGVLSGLLGIGGGMLINPVLMEFGMSPQMTAATGPFMVFFSSSLSVLQYWLVGRIPVDYALWFSMACFVCSLVGLLVVQRVIQRFGRASVIVFVVASVIALSAVLMAFFGGLDIWQEYMDGDYMGFHSPC